MIFIQNERKMEGSRVSTAIGLYSNTAFDKVLYVSLAALELKLRNVAWVIKLV